MKHYLWIPILCLLLGGCSKEPSPETGPGQLHSLRIAFVPEESRTRSPGETDESRIYDVNLYIVHTASGRVSHSYRTGSDPVTLDLMPGDYTFYAVANAGRDLGEMTEAALQTLAAPFSGEPGDGTALPMAARSELCMAGPASLTLRLRRLVSKLSLSLSVAPALQSALTIESVQLLSVPGRCLCFADNRNTDAAYSTDYPSVAVSGQSFRHDYYLPENMAGVNASVASERQKDKAHAPSGATWLRIKGRHNDRPCTYSVYLGANNTTDFNVERNTFQYLNVTLSGSEPTDLRVSCFSLSLGTPAASYLPLDKVSVPLTFTAENQAGNSFTLRCALTQGKGRVLLDGTDITSAPVSLPSTGSSRTLTFEPTADGQQVSLTLTVSDARGQQVSRSLTTCIAPRGELLFTLPSLGNPRANNRTGFTFTVGEENYNEPFHLQLLTSTPSSTATFYFQGRQLTPGMAASFGVEAGTHTIEIEAGNAVGEIDLTATVADAWGSSREVRQTARVAYDQLTIRPDLSLETARETVSGGAFYIRNTVVFWVLAERPVPVEVTVSTQVFCEGRHTADGHLQTVPVTVRATIPAGSTSAYVRTPWPMDAVGYYERNDLVALHGYEYVRMYYETGSIQPATDKGVSFYFINNNTVD